MKLAILLTGTVKPAVIGGSFSVEERMKMYEGTLRFVTETFSEKYNSPKARLKNRIRQLLRYIFPNIWF